MNKHAVVIGGGVSGLTIAFRLRQSGVPGITVLEAGDRFGGVIRTLRGDGFHIEAGADSFDGGEPAMLDLCQGLGLRDELVECAPALNSVFLSRNKKLFPIDPLFSSPFAFLRNPALSLPAKVRLLLERFIPRGEEIPDEPIGAFVRRRFGRVALEELAEPLTRGVLMAEAGKLSLREYFREWQAMERECGSITKAILIKKASTSRSRPFFTLRGGLEKLIAVLLASLKGVELRVSSEAAVINRDGNWKVMLKNGETVPADAVCLAVPAPKAARLLSGFAPQLCEQLFKIRYDSVAAVNMIFRCEAIPESFLKSGFVVPARGKEWPFASLKVIGATEDGKFIRIRAFISGVFQPGTFAFDDERIKHEVLGCLAAEWGIRLRPSLISVERYPEALAQYETGHGQRVSGIEQMLDSFPGLFIAGNGYHGFGISDCVREAGETAQRIAAFLTA